MKARQLVGQEKDVVFEFFGVSSLLEGRKGNEGMSMIIYLF